MGRIPTLSYSLRQRLHAMYKPGEKKILYKRETGKARSALRAKLITEGYSKAEAYKISMGVNTYSDTIFSKSTLSTYVKAIGPFAEFVVANEGKKRVSIETAKEYIQPYINHRESVGLSPATIKKDLAAICKALGAVISDYTHPAYHYGERRRGGERKAINDERNEQLHGDILYLNRCIGLRRAELARLKLSDITYAKYGYMKVVTRRGKGGKRNVNLVTDPKKISYIEDYIGEARECGREYLLSKDDLSNDADLHSMRAMAAKDRYHEVTADMARNPERRDYYKGEILRMFKEAGKNLKESLDSPYVCRGYNRTLLRQSGTQTKWDRVAVLYTSLTVLSHFRSSVTVNYYLTH